MKVVFGQEKLEILTPKFIIQLFGYLDRSIDKVGDRLSVLSVEKEERDSLNDKTIIILNGEENIKYQLEVLHAKDMCCSNWCLKKLVIKEAV